MEYTDNFWNELCKKYLQEGISLTKLAKEYNIDRRTLSKRFKEIGIDVINNHNIVKFDESVFDNIDSEEKAYWLGFIFADGYISNKNAKYKNVFEMSLKLSDIDHLIKFNSFMKHNSNHIKCDNHRCRWCIMNKHLWETLNNYGCVPNKSLILKFPELTIFKNTAFTKHFIRGYFDGDGCISFHKYKHVVSPYVSVLGTYEFLEKIIDVSNIPAVFKHDKRHNSKTFLLEYTKENGIKMINWLYSDSTIYLNRKYQRYNFFKNGSRSLQEWYEWLSTKNGELCDENTVVIENSNEFSTPYSVETETNLLE